MGYNPPGTTRMDPVDPQTIEECWIQQNSFPNLAALAANPATSEFLEAYIIEACAAINDLCNRQFNKQQQDQVFISKDMMFSEYNRFALNNRPLESVDNVWLQIGSTFSVVATEYTQIDTVSGFAKILPNILTTAASQIQNRNDSVNVWIRYTAGYAVDYSDSNTINEVPMAVRRATAKYVDYLFASDGFTPGIKEFRTQTYQQKNSTAGGDDDPVLSMINKLLTPYRVNRIVA